MRLKFSISFFAIVALLSAAFMQPAEAADKKLPAKISLANYQKKSSLKDWAQRKKTASHSMPMLRNFPAVNLPTLSGIELDGSRTFETALLYSDQWLEYYTPYGVARLQLASPPVFNQLFENEDLPQSGGGFFTDKYYYMTNYSEDWFTGELAVKTLVYDRATWNEVFEIDQDYTALATDLAYDAIDDLAYGCFNNGNGVSWGYMNPNSLSVTHVATLDGELVAVAIDSHGQAYGITNGGYLVKVNKKNGELTPVGYTGITPAYLQSATFGDDDVLYWAASLSDDSSGLYTVDLSTGVASLLTGFPNAEEVVAIYMNPATPAADAPDKINSLTLSFVDDQLSGTVNFTVPTTTASGNELTGNVDYVVTVDGEQLDTGTATAGQQVAATVTLANAGFHYFVVKLSNEAGSSEPTSLRQWVGIDQPKPATNVVMAKTGEREAQITWDAPTASVHGGYFSSSRISYDITRLPDGKVVATDLKTTTFTDNVDISGQALVKYSVVAKADDVESLATESNGIIFGDAFEVPVHFSFDTEDEFNIFTIIDNNETPALDSGCWLYSPSAQCTGYNTGTKDGDDWLITPSIALKADRQYTFQYDVCCYSDYWPDEYSVYMGTAATVEGMTTELLPKTTIYWDEMRTKSFTITVPEDGNYYFGFYATSEAGGAFFLIDDIKVTESYTLKAPAQATNVTVTAGENGQSTATVNFIAPEKCVDGTMLNNITSITLTRNNQEVKTFSNPEPGEPLSFTEENVPDGMATYEIVSTNEFGSGPAATGEAWIGVDYPTAPLNAKVSLNSDGHPVITWEAPQGPGYYGGYVGDNLTYSVYNISTGNFIQQGIEGLSYVDEAVTESNSGDQKLLQYAVYAKSDKGLGVPATAICITGANYELPFIESFANHTFTYLWGFNGTNGESWVLGDDWSYYSQDDDDGLLAYLPNVAGSQVTAFSGKIAVKDAQNPVLSFYVNKLEYENNGFYETNPDDDELYVQVAADGFDFSTVKTIRMAEVNKSGYQLYEVPLSQFAQNEFIVIAFQENAVSDQTPIMIDNIKIESRLTDNLSLVEIDAPESVEVNQEFNIEVSIANNGTNDAENFSIELYRGDELEQTIDGQNIAANQTTNYTFNLTALQAWGNEETFMVKVVYNLDNYLSDNESEPFTIEVVRPFLPAPTNLAATVNEDIVTFTWDAPEGIEVSSEIVTEDFEGYTHGARTFGNWITKDEATFGDYGIIDIEDASGSNIDFPYYLEEQAFMIFSPASAWLDIEENPQWAPHSGSKMAISICDYANTFGSNYRNNDWLISPQLDGNEQTISFYARTASATERKDYLEVRYSTTDTETSSFALVSRDVIQLNTEWTRYEVTLPEGTKYFALRNNSDMGTGVLLDDITYSLGGEAPALTLLGYNLYCNGNLVNESLITGTSFDVANPEIGDYTVKAVYQVGESEASNVYVLSITSINNILQPFNENEPFYDLMGRRVLRPIEGGIYLQKGRKIIYHSR